MEMKGAHLAGSAQMKKSHEPEFEWSGLFDSVHVVFSIFFVHFRLLMESLAEYHENDDSYIRKIASRDK